MLKKFAITTIPAVALGAALLLTSKSSADALPLANVKAVTANASTALGESTGESEIEAAHGRRGRRGGFRGFRGRRGGFRHGWGGRRHGGFRHGWGGRRHSGFRHGWGGRRYGGYRYGSYRHYRGGRFSHWNF